MAAFEAGAVSDKEAASEMEHAHELLKSRPSDAAVQDMVCQSLKNDKCSHTKVYTAEKMHKRLLKCKADAKAKTFSSAAQALYPQSLHFSGKGDEQ